MKIKTSPKIKTSKIVKTPNAAACQGEVIPPGLEFFAEMKSKSPMEQIAAVMPIFASNLAADDSLKMDKMAALLSGIELDLGVPIPFWAKTASKKFWEATGFDFLANLQDKNGELSLSDIGKTVELMELMPKTISPTKPEQAMQALVKYVKADALNLPAVKNMEFASGRMNVVKKIERGNNLTQRAKIYIMIAITWREIENFKSAGQLHNWLLKNGIIVPSTDPAETRKVCRLIGLKLREKAGRPPK